MSDRIKNGLAKILLLSPLAFICHVVEEGPGFVEWFNAHVTRGITSRLFWSVNFIALAITILIAVVNRLAQSPAALTIASAWLSFLMFANALFHIAGAFIDGGYVPGLATAAFLYLPFYFLLMNRIVRSGQINTAILAGAVILGSMPMLIHGYRILFLRSRLF